MARRQLTCECHRTAGDRPGAHIKALGSRRERVGAGLERRPRLSRQHFLPTRERECGAKARHRRKETTTTTTKRSGKDKENAMLCPSCAKWSLFCQELTKGEAVKGTEGDEERGGGLCWKPCVYLRRRVTYPSRSSASSPIRLYSSGQTEGNNNSH